MEHSSRPLGQAVRLIIAIMLAVLGLSIGQAVTTSAKSACTSTNCPSGQDSDCGGNCTCSMPGNACVFWP